MSEVQMEFSRITQRLMDLEIKTVFLEKELEEYKEAVQFLHGRLMTIEESMDKIQENVTQT